MLSTLLESGVRAPSRSGGGGVSLFTHAIIIAGAIAGTAQSPLTARDLPPVEVVPISIAPHRVEVAPRRDHGRSASSLSVPDLRIQLPLLEIPDRIPIGLPSPTFDPSPPNDATVFGRRSAGLLGGGDDSTGGGGGLNTNPWMGAELLTHMLGKPNPPRYPGALQRAGVEGEVLTKFVIDTTGRIDMSSLEIVRSTHELFTASVREVLPTLRFQPSMIGDRKVKAAAILPFVFQIRKEH